MAETEEKTGAKNRAERPALAVIRVRGLVGVRADIKEALSALKLRKKHACVIVDDTRVLRGQLRKCKDYVTYGTITDETKRSLEARGAKSGVFHLPPPRGGWKSTKRGVNAGGALGDRGAMDGLLKRIL